MTLEPFRILFMADPMYVEPLVAPKYQGFWGFGSNIFNASIAYD